jgi:GMP synthase (glutamine-hydrolysing)
MPRCLVLQHVDVEGAGRIADLFAERGHIVETVALHRGEPVPATVSAEIPLVVMGGAMGVSDLGDPRYPFLAAEVALLRARLAAGAPNLGVCLGSQLLAHAAGARVYPNSREGRRVYEIGYGPVDFLGDELLPDREVMVHWHGDTFDLPAGAVHLASTAECPHQAFRLGRSYALQFHPELEAPTVEEWLRLDAPYVINALGPEGPDRIRGDAARDHESYRIAGDRLLRKLIDRLL